MPSSDSLWLRYSTDDWAMESVIFLVSSPPKKNAEQHHNKGFLPLPRVDDLMDSLSDACLFSIIDLRSGYWQVEVAPADPEKTAFTL